MTWALRGSGKTLGQSLKARLVVMQVERRYQLDQQARQSKRQPRAASIELRDDRLNKMRVVPHDLAAYDRLTKKDKSK